MCKLQRARNARDSITGFRKFSGKSSQFAVVISVGTGLNVFSLVGTLRSSSRVSLNTFEEEGCLFMIAITVIDHSH